MTSWQNIKRRLTFLRRLPNKYYFVAGVFLVMAVYLVAFREKTLAYSYGGETCDRRLIVFPGLFKQTGDEGYEVTTKGGWTVLGRQVTATSLCFSPSVAPTEQSSQTVAFAPFSSWYMRLTYEIESGQHPKIDASVLDTPIAVSRELELPLNEPDATFAYQIKVSNRQAPCSPSGALLACDIPTLKLEQGNKYNLTLERYFKDKKIDEVTQTDIKTLSPLTVTDSSIKNDATVYHKPTSVTITTNKPVGKADFIVWRTDGEKPVELKLNTEFKEKETTVRFNEGLPRQATIKLEAKSFESVDGSVPLDPYTLVFKTSGGPRVTGVNVGSSGVAMGSQIVVTFDQELSSEQDIGPLITTAGGLSYQARQGNQLFFSTGGAGRCQDISITLKPNIKSPYGISGQSAWKYNGRTICYTVTTIGTSAQGRAINAYHFGTNGPSVIYTGAIHGNELSTKFLMERWIQELDGNPGQIPAGKRVIVIPSLNPDGVAAGARVNARNVDLNRNFAVSDWKKDIEHTNGSAFPGGGGKEPMSEPETKSIASFMAQQQAELVVSYHSIGGLVISNKRGQADTRASQYASLSGYSLSMGGGGEFGYQITGTADDYYSEKLGLPSILIELGSHSYHQFERNRAAMWAMMR